MADVAFPKRFQRVGRMGAYLRIISEGDVGAGDTIEVTAVPAHGVTLADMVSALHDGEKADLIQRIERLPAFWHDVASRKR
jgi:MOSC domain-containing protein YiiM